MCTQILNSAHNNITATSTDCAILRLWKMSTMRGLVLKTPSFTLGSTTCNDILQRGQPQSFLGKWNFLRLQLTRQKGLAPYFLYRRPDLENILQLSRKLENILVNSQIQEEPYLSAFPLLLPAKVCREHIHLWRADHDDWHIPASVHQPAPVLLQWPGPWKCKNRDSFLCFALNTYGLLYKHTTKGKSHLLCTIWPISIPFPCLQTPFTILWWGSTATN